MSNIESVVKFIYFFLFYLIINGCSTHKDYYDGLNMNRITLIKSDTLYQFYALPVKATDTRRLSNEKYYAYFMNDSILTTRGSFSGKLLDGKYIELYPSRTLKVKGKYQKGLKEGKWKTWFGNGEMESEYTWINGDQDGRFSEYNYKGKLIKWGSYKNSQPDGEFSESLQDGRMHKIIYKAGIIVSDTIINNLSQ